MQFKRYIILLISFTIFGCNTVYDLQLWTITKENIRKNTDIDIPILKNGYYQIDKEQYDNVLSKTGWLFPLVFILADDNYFMAAELGFSNFPAWYQWTYDDTIERKKFSMQCCLEGRYLSSRDKIRIEYFKLTSELGLIPTNSIYTVHSMDGTILNDSTIIINAIQFKYSAELYGRKNAVHPKEFAPPLIYHFQRSDKSRLFLENPNRSNHLSEIP